MAKPISSREFSAEMKRLGATERKCKSSHTVWTCAASCGKHKTTVIIGHRIVEPACVRQVKNVFTCMTFDFRGN